MPGNQLCSFPSSLFIEWVKCRLLSVSLLHLFHLFVRTTCERSSILVVRTMRSKDGILVSWWRREWMYLVYLLIDMRNNVLVSCWDLDERECRYWLNEGRVRIFCFLSHILTRCNERMTSCCFFGRRCMHTYMCRPPKMHFLMIPLQLTSG